MAKTLTVRAGAAALLACAGSAMSQTTLYGVDFGGNFYRINTTTGAATLVGATGFTRLNAAAADSQGRVYAWRDHNPGSTTDVDQLIRINPATGVGTLLFTYPSTADVRGIAFGSGDVLYAIRDNSQPPNPGSSIDDLVTVDLVTGAITLVGPTTFTDLQGLTSAPGGALFACGVLSTGTLYRIDPGSGATVVVATGISGQQAMEWASGTTAWMARSSLLTVDLVSGATVTVGALGATTDMRGLAAVRVVSCYANCDNSTTPPILNVQDFGCFLNAFANGETYANCDNSTTPPVLNVQDFGCFLNLFAAGCS